MKSAFSERLSALRREKGLSQRLAAADLCISQALLSHYENDAREPKLEFVVKACDYYGVPADYILGRSDERGDESAQLLKSVNETLASLEALNLAEAELIAKLTHSSAPKAKGARKKQAPAAPK